MAAPDHAAARRLRARDGKLVLTHVGFYHRRLLQPASVVEVAEETPGRAESTATA